MELICKTCGRKLKYPSSLPDYISIDLARQYASEFYGWGTILNEKIEDLCPICRASRTNANTVYLHL
jgi:hypothetical protein